MLFDIYHQQRTEGNILERIEKNIDIIGHFHVADSPKRTEPGTGELNWKNILSAIEKTGYPGYVGLEYRATRPVMKRSDLQRRSDLWTGSRFA